MCSRSPTDVEHFPEEFERPVARAVHLLDASAEAIPVTETPEQVDADSKSVIPEIVDVDDQSVNFLTISMLCVPY